MEENSNSNSNSNNIILGKEYYDSNLVFEGEYFNGKRNGKGKEYNEQSKLIFEGEYCNGKRNGKGKEYDYKGNLIYDGTYLNGIYWTGYFYDIHNKTSI